MPVTHFDDNGVATHVIAWADAIEEAVARKHGPRVETVWQTREGDGDGVDPETYSETIVHRTPAEEAALAAAYALGAYPVGSTRDPETGVVTPYVAPAQTDAERAAEISLSAADFYVALMGSSVIDMGGAADPEAWLVAQIDASALPAETKAVARVLARKATQFHRADPDRPGLMEAIAAILPRGDGEPGGLASAEIDALFLWGTS